MGLKEDVLALAQEQMGSNPMCGDTDDLFTVFGLEGDDADEFMIAFGERLGVDLSGFLSYFHYNADEPPLGRRLVPIDVQGREIPWMPVTLDNLVAAVHAGKWAMEYPPHTVKNRWWSLFKQLGITLICGAVLLIAVSAII